LIGDLSEYKIDLDGVTREHGNTKD
jgi:hypothetical protein